MGAGREENGRVVTEPQRVMAAFSFHIGPQRLSCDANYVALE